MAGDDVEEGIGHVRDILANAPLECAGVLTIRATARHSRAIDATADLLSKQRMECAFTGSVARAAWLGGLVDSGSVDVLALMQPQQKNNIAMMASHRGFRVEQEEIDASEELDLVPLNFVDADGDVRVHVLLASNALYAKMITAGVPAMLGEREIRVPSAEDFALLATLGEDDDAVRALTGTAGFNRDAFNEKMMSIGLGAMVLQ